MTLKLFECFAGYGGASWGLKLAGIPYKCIGFSEIKKNAIKCYEQNFPGTKNYGDITKINWTEVPDFDLLTGGFPCQDVSTQGKQDLCLGRTILIDELIKILKIKQPKYFLFENVVGLTNQKFKSFLRKIRLDLIEAGYTLFFKELNSSDFGSPTIRTRVWFIGFRKDLNKGFGDYPYPLEVNEFKVIEDILDPEFIDYYWFKRENQIIIHNNLFGNSTTFNLMENIYPVLHNKRKELRVYGQNFITNHASSYHVLDVKGLCQTLTCGITPFFLINNRIRKPTKKELFRLMGFFKDEINLEGLSWGMCLDLAGDGWDVNLVKQIFLSMKMNEVMLIV